MQRNVTVIRDGVLSNIGEEDLCVGDMVIVQTGEIVPADLRLTKVRGLEVDEFDITGEILGVIKTVNENHTILYKGSRVIRGTGQGIVVAIGGQTEMGKVLSQEREQDQPYHFQIVGASHLWPIFLLLPAHLIFLLQSKHGAYVVPIFFLAILFMIFLQNNEFHNHLILCAILKKSNIQNMQIQDLRVLEQIKKVDTICFDKTGVLTTRRLNISKLHFVDNVVAANQLEPGVISDGIIYLLNTACALCNDIQFVEKYDLANPIDRAFIDFAKKNSIVLQEVLSNHQRIYDMPFDSENRFMACGFVTKDGEKHFFTKGDPDTILGICDQYITSCGTLTKLDASTKASIKSNVESINNHGNTAIALAFSLGKSVNPPEKFILLCVFQIENPLQSGVQKSIETFSKNGIKCLLITGDKSETAIKIGEVSGITNGNNVALTGPVVERLDWKEVARQAAYVSVFSRLTPSQKGYLVRKIQQAGHHVAMVGDGSNDGIALKVADIGISFTTNSSAIARKQAKILIRELTDLVSLFQYGNKVWNLERQAKILRFILIALVYIGSYCLPFVPQFLR